MRSVVEKKFIVSIGARGTLGSRWPLNMSKALRAYGIFGLANNPKIERLGIHALRPPPESIR